MPIVVADLCRLPGNAPDTCAFRLPGGVLFEIPYPEGIPSPLDIIQQGMAMIQPALAPLAPIFCIIEVVIALKECAEVVPDSLGPPPDPTAVVSAVSNLLEKVGCLLGLIPQLSVPFMVADVVDLIIKFLLGLVSLLSSLSTQLARIQAARELGNTVPEMLLAAQCASDTMDSQLDALNKTLGPVNILITLINSFAKAVGLPELPSLENLGESIEDTVDVLVTTVEILVTIRQAIPVPPA